MLELEELSGGGNIMPIIGLDRMPGSGLARGTLFDKELNSPAIDVVTMTITGSIVLEKSSENKYTVSWTQPSGDDRTLSIPALSADDEFTFNDATQTLTNKALTGVTDFDMTAGNKTILDTIGSNTLTIGAGGTTVTIAGNLTVSGTTTTVNTTTLNIADSLYVLNSDETGTPSQDSGFIVERGSSTNVGLFWDESADEFVFVNTSEDGTTAGNVTIASYASLQVATLKAATSLLPDASGGADIGSASAEWGDIYVGDDKKIMLGDGQDVSLEYDEDGTDTLLITGNVTFADGSTDVNIASHDTSNGLKLGGTLVTSTAAELNKLDGTTATAASLTWTKDLYDTGVTATEFDLLDGGSSIGTTAVSDGHGIVMNHGGTMAQTTVQTLAAYLDDEITAMPNVTTLAGLTTIGAVANALAMTFSDVTLFHDANNADTSFSIGTSAAEALKIEVLNGGSNKTAEEVHFSTATASGTADHGKMVFDVDGTDILTIDDGGISIAANKAFEVAGTAILSDSSGTMTLSNVDALDATTEATIEAAIDTLSNLTAASALVTVSALDSGSITSGFGNIDNGSSTITTTGAITGGSVVADDVSLNGKTITMVGSTDDTAVLTVATNGAFSIVTTDTAAAAANIQITADGTVDIDSAGVLTLDSGAAINIEPAAGSAILLDGTISIDGSSIYATDLILGEDAQTAIDFGTANEIDFIADNAARLTLTSGALYPVTNNQIDLGTASLEFKDAFFDGTVTADAFAGPLTGNVTGNASGTAATVTGAAQSAITSLGTLTTLTVDNIIINGTNIGHTSDTDAIAIASDGVVTMNQIPVFSAGINVSGGTIAGTLATAAQGNITSLGTLTALTVDDVAIDGKVITMTGDTSDTVVFTAGTHGTLSIVTTDDAAAAANIQITADGTAELAGTTVTLDSGADIVLSAAGGQVTVDDGSTTVLTFDAAEPSLTISDDADTGDNFKISVGAAALTTIATTDDDAGLGHLTIRPDGYLIVQQDAVTLDATLDNISLVAKDFDSTTNSAIAIATKGTGTKPSIFLGTGNNSHHMMLSTGSRQQASVWTGGGIAPDANNATIMEAISTSSAIYRHWYGGHYFYGDGNASQSAHDGGDPNEFAPTLLATISPTNGSAGSITGALGILGGIFVGVADLGDYDTFTGDLTKLVDDASNGSGAATLYIGNTSITTSSDRRIKKDIVDTSVNALDTLDKLRVVDFTWDDPTDIAPNNRNMRGQWTGMIAQEAVDVVPYIINAPRTEDGVIDYDDETTWTVDYQHLVPMLVKAIQELKQEIAELKGGN